MVGQKTKERSETNIVKSELINKTWDELNKDFKKYEVEKVVNTFLIQVENVLKNGEDIKIPGVGSFKHKFRNTNVGNNISKNNINVPVKQHYICFKPSKNLK